MGNDGQLAWDLGTLRAGAFPHTFNVAARIDAGIASGALLTVTAQAGASDAEVRLDNNSDSAALVVQPAGPDLAVSSSLPAAAMTVDQPVSFTLQVANQGNVPAAGAALTLTLPPSVTLRTAIPGPSMAAPGRLVWNVGNMAPDAAQSFTVTVALDPALAAFVPDPGVAPAATGLLTYTLSAGSQTADANLANNSENVAKHAVLAGSDVAVWLSAIGAGDPATLATGQDLTITLRYANLGNRPASSTSVTLSLWSGLSLTIAQPSPSRTATSSIFAGGLAVWDVGNLRVGESGEIQGRVHAVSVPPEGSLMMATLATTGPDLHLGNNVDQEWRRSASLAGPRREYLPVMLRGAAGT